MNGAVYGGVEGFLTLLIVVAVVAAAVRHIHLPYTVALVFSGLALAYLPNSPHIELTPAIIFAVFLPVLLFYGAYNLDAEDLRAVIRPVTLLAVPGVVATAAIVGVALHEVTTLTWAEAFLFGTIVAATDPVAVLALFADVGAPRRLNTIVAAESLFNDGTALVLFATMLQIVTSHAVSPGATLERFIVDLLGSLALGLAVGLVASTVLHRIDDALLEMTLTLIVAYGGFLLADRLTLSGPLETVAAGLFLGWRGADVMSPTTRLQARAIWDFLDFLANSLLFLLMGLALRSIGPATTDRIGFGILLPLLVVVVAGTLGRVFVVGAVQLLLRRIHFPMPRGWPVVLSWSGLRGAVSLAAALSLPAGIAHRQLLLALTFGFVLFTLVVQGLTIRTVVERLGLATDEPSRHDLEVLTARLRMVDAAIREVQALQAADGDGIDPHLAKRLLHDYAASRHEIAHALEEHYHSDEAREEAQERQVQRRLLRIQRETARAVYNRGRISQAVLREVTQDLDDRLAALDPFDDP